MRFFLYPYIVEQFVRFNFWTQIVRKDLKVCTFLSISFSYSEYAECSSKVTFTRFGTLCIMNFWMKIGHNGSSKHAHLCELLFLFQCAKFASKIMLLFRNTLYSTLSRKTRHTHNYYCLRMIHQRVIPFRYSRIFSIICQEGNIIQFIAYGTRELFARVTFFSRAEHERNFRSKTYVNFSCTLRSMLKTVFAENWNWSRYRYRY